ncbi:MAG: GNAT family N-acetyltransferase, partial [Acidobacteriota bacterium]
MVEGLTIRPFQPGDEAAINDGFNAVFGLNRPLEEWRWKFHDGPEGRWIMLAVDGDGCVCAHYGAVPVRMRVGDVTFRAGQPVDIFTRPAARRGLAAARTLEATVERFFAEFGHRDRLALLFGFPGHRHLRLGLARLGYEQMPPLPVRQWVRDAGRSGKWLHRHRVAMGFDRETAEELWSRAGRRYGAAVVRDGERLARRYTARPGQDYLHLFATRRGTAHAWCVARIGAPVTWVADLLWDGEDRRALEALDREVATAARAAGAERLAMWLMGDAAAERALSDLGWRETLQSDGLATVARSFDARID